MASVSIDDTTEEGRLLYWPESKAWDSVQVHDLNIKSDETGRIYWDKKTTQPIPRDLMAFEFSATIVKIGQFKGNETVKLVSGRKQLEYNLNNGKIEHVQTFGKGMEITTFKPLSVNDTISFTLRRIVIDSKTFNLCQIRVNGEQCCSEVVLEGIDVYPALHIESPGLEIHTAFFIPDTQGNECVFTYFFNN